MTAPVQVGPSPTSGGPVRLSTIPNLAANELDVLRGAANGETYADTANRIFLTEKSVSNVATRVMRKLNAKTMAQAVLLACQAGILDGRRRRHGDHAGYVAHTRLGEDPCDACDAGERAYRAGLRANRKRIEVDAA